MKADNLLLGILLYTSITSTHVSSKSLRGIISTQKHLSVSQEEIFTPSNNHRHHYNNNGKINSNHSGNSRSLRKSRDGRSSSSGKSSAKSSTGSSSDTSTINKRGKSSATSKSSKGSNTGNSSKNDTKGKSSKECNKTSKSNKSNTLSKSSKGSYTEPSTSSGCSTFGTSASDFPGNPFRALMDDAVINSDLYEDNDGNYPVLDIMRASLGFEGINGVPVSEIDYETALSVGGVYETLPCGDAIISPLTTTQVFNSGGFPVLYGDGFPIQFTFPVLVSDMRRDWIQVKLNNGTTFTPAVATVTPAADYNEKNNIVLFDPNLAPSSRATKAEVDSGTCTGDCYYVSEVEIIGPIRFVGPNGRLESAEGIVATVEFDPYDDTNPNGGNQIIRAKLNECDSTGDEGHWLWGDSAPPNSCADVYGSAADYRIRLFTMWGAFKEGRLPILPTDYSRYFTLVAILDDGSELALAESGVEYDIDGETITVLGLAETGRSEAAGDPYDDCYYDDHDNLIDVVIQGSSSAVTKIKHVVHKPSDGTHEPFYNPGAAGSEGSFNPAFRYTVASNDHIVDIYDGVTGDPRTTSYGSKFGQSAVPITLAINGLDASDIENDLELACNVIGGDMQAFFQTLAPPSPNCLFDGNLITAYMPVMSVCDRDVVNALGLLTDQMTFANTEATYGGTYTASPVGRRLEDTNLEDNGSSPLGPVTCSDGVTLGWTNFTALNFALRITNYLCNVVNFEEACAPVFTICPDTPFEDVQPIVIDQNDVVIQCGYNGTGVGAGGCILETSADLDLPGMLVKDNTVAGQLLNDTSAPVTGITVKGMSFVNKGGSTSIGISPTTGFLK